MPNEILLYGQIDSYSSRDIVQQMVELDSDECTLLVNTPGGEPTYAWGVIGRFAKFEKRKIEVHGKAYSFGTFACCYSDNVEALDVSEFMVHRAAYPEWIESSPEYFTEAIRQNLASINANLEKAFRNKVDVAVFEETMDVKIKDIFSMDSRIDVFFNAIQAKKFKLIESIVTITPSKKSKIESSMAEITARYTGVKIAALEVKEESQKTIYMTIEKIKSEHPALYAQIVAEGHKEGFAAGVSAEKDRVDSIMVFNEIDPVACKAAVDSGKPLTQKQMSEFALKSFSKETLKKVEGDSAEAVTTAEVPVKKVETEKEKKVEAFQAEVYKNLGIGKK